MGQDDPELNAAKIRDELKQLRPLLPAFAECGRAYYDEFRKQEFTPDQALYMTTKILISLSKGEQ